MKVPDNRCCLCGEPIGSDQYMVPEYSEAAGKVVSQRDAIVVTSCRLVTHHEDMYVPVGKCRVEILETAQVKVAHRECWKEVMRKHVE